MKDLVDKSSETDQAVLVRFPPSITEELKQLSNEDINIKIQPTNDPDTRLYRYLAHWHRFQLNDNEYPATLVDLPTVIEAHKTLDYKTVFKSADVGQMLIVHQVPPGISIQDFDPFTQGWLFPI